jgi:hypothetical protein
VKHCRVHTDEVASPDCEGWRVDDLCDRCLHALGYPSQEPLWGEVHRVSHELLGFSNAHPEAIAYALHFGVHPTLLSRSA